MEKKEPTIPEPPPPVPEHHYPKQKDYYVKTNIGPLNGRPILPNGVALLELPVSERKKYMWAVPDHLKTLPMYDQHEDDFKPNPDNPLLKDPKEKKLEEQKIQIDEQKSQIDLLTNHVNEMTNQMNTIMKLLTKNNVK